MNPQAHLGAQTGTRGWTVEGRGPYTCVFKGRFWSELWCPYSHDRPLGADFALLCTWRRSEEFTTELWLSESADTSRRVEFLEQQWCVGSLHGGSSSQPSLVSAETTVTSIP